MNSYSTAFTVTYADATKFYSKKRPNINKICSSFGKIESRKSRIYTNADTLQFNIDPNTQTLFIKQA